MPSGVKMKANCEDRLRHGTHLASLTQVFVFSTGLRSLPPGPLSSLVLGNQSGYLQFILYMGVRLSEKYAHTNIHTTHTYTDEDKLTSRFTEITKDKS